MSSIYHIIHIERKSSNIIEDKCGRQVWKGRRGEGGMLLSYVLSSFFIPFSPISPSHSRWIYIETRMTTSKKAKLGKTFTVWLRNQLIFGVMEPVLTHTEKSCITSYYRQFSTNIKMKITINTSFVSPEGPIIFHFNINIKWLYF